MLDGGDAAAAADALLERVPSGFVQSGGETACLELQNGATRALRTKDFDGSYCHAATCRLDDGTHRVQIGGEMNGLHVVLAAVDKDSSSKRPILLDADAGGLCCWGVLCSAGKVSRGTAATAGELQIDLDATKRTAAFRQQGRLLGKVTGLPSAVKLVVSLGYEEFVTLL